MNPQGIRQALYYIRVPGPKSVAIETPEQRREIIHRCDSYRCPKVLKE